MWKLRVIVDDRGQADEVPIEGVVDARGTATADQVMADPVFDKGAAANATPARVSGVVVDVAGAVIAGATVTSFVVGARTPGLRVVTDSAGQFWMALPPGWRRVQIESSGSATRRIVMRASAAAAVDLDTIRLEIGDITMGIIVVETPRRLRG